MVLLVAGEIQLPTYPPRERRADAGAVTLGNKVRVLLAPTEMPLLIEVRLAFAS